jgi:hypothetical protein
MFLPSGSAESCKTTTTNKSGGQQKGPGHERPQLPGEASSCKQGAASDASCGGAGAARTHSQAACCNPGFAAQQGCVEGRLSYMMWG